jgi:hypothetical protein
VLRMMSSRSNIEVDPWLHRGVVSALPAEARFACAYLVDVGIGDLSEVAFFGRTDGRDELWIVMDANMQVIATLAAAAGRSVGQDVGINAGRAVSRPLEGAEGEAALELLGILFRSRVGFSWPSRFLAAGIVSASAFDGVVRQMEDELKANAAAAARNETVIVKTARELGLRPQPTGTHPALWRATCPKTNHHLDIDASAGQFGCGWCRRRGGPEDLRAFAAERDARG